MTNEQRAHDLTIMILSRLDIANEDTYGKYKDIYSQAIEAFNRDYPNGL